MNEQESGLYKRAYLFASFIVVYNIVEGIVSMIIGYRDESLTLFGFGVDSFIEVASNLGVLYMIRRIQQNPDGSKTLFERGALQITGYGFLSFVFRFGNRHSPEYFTERETGKHVLGDRYFLAFNWNNVLCGYFTN